MDIERTLETQRLRLLRIVAGLVVVLGVLAVGPVSRRFSDWTLGFVGPLLSRVEVTVRYLVMTQACLMVDRCGLDVERHQIAVPAAPVLTEDETDISLADCRRRLTALRSLLLNLPRHALRLLRRIARQRRRGTNESLRGFELCRTASLQSWRRVAPRIERPPDKARFASLFLLPPPGCRAGDIDG